jgi:NAD(P)-dependent dehydrogenase (short-subunit alcohol dehydrogenase family)
LTRRQAVITDYALFIYKQICDRVPRVHALPRLRQKPQVGAHRAPYGHVRVVGRKAGRPNRTADLADRDAIGELLEAAGEIDVLVANAALPATGLLADYSIGEIDRALEVNLRAPIVMAKLAGERMAKR